METHQLEKAMKNDPCLSRSTHLGVLSADELSLIKRPGAYIINTDPSHLSGQHWLAMYIGRNGSVEVFDSLGYHPNHYPFLRMYLKGKTFTHNSKRWQKSGTITCGQFCLFYLYHKCRGWTLKDIVDFYRNDDLNENKHLVVQFVGQYFCIPCLCRLNKRQCARPCV
jgi:hypothetical protein